MAQVFLVMTAGGVNTADPSTWPLDRAIISHDGEVTGLTNGVDYFAVAASEASPVFSPFHPAVFSPLALWDLSDHSTVFQDAMGTVPTGVGDPVRYISDLSGNGNHIVTPSDAARGAKHIVDGVSWVELDGVDDTFEAALTGLSGDHTAIIGFRPVSKATGNDSSISLSGANDYQSAAGGGLPYIGVTVSTNLGMGTFNLGSSQTGDIAQTLRLDSNSGQGDLFLDGVRVSGDSGYNGALSPSQTLRIGANRGANAFLNMRFYAGAIFNRALTDAEIAQMAAWIAGKQGRTL